MEEKFIDNSKDERIIIFGPEGSWKSTILNSLVNFSNFVVNDPANYAEINGSKNFCKKTLLIEECQFDLIDTIGIMPSYKINELPKKLEKFQKLIKDVNFSLVLITFPIKDLDFDYSALNLLLNTLYFTNNKKVFLVLTKGENIENSETREECYDTFNENLKGKVLRKGLELNFKNVIIYESSKIEEFRKTILLKARDENNKYTQIDIKKSEGRENNLNDIQKLEQLFACEKVGSSQKDDSPFSLIEFFSSLLEKCPFLNSPNMII